MESATSIVRLNALSEMANVPDEIINEPFIVTNATSAIMPPAGNTFGLREYMLVKGKEEKQQ
jgi:hypothetical protein